MNIMKKTFVIFLALTYFSQNKTIAQQTLHLEEAIRIGLANRIELKNQALQIQLISGENEKLKAKWLPQINGSADMRWNTQLQTTVLPFDISGQNPDGTSTVKLGLPFTNSLGIQAEQKLFDANKKIERQLITAQTENQQLTLEQQQIAVRKAITEAYFGVLYNKERVDFAQKQLARANVNAENAATKFQAGTILENELNRLALDVSNAKLTLQKATQDYTFSLESLRYQMATNEKIGEISATLDEFLNVMDGVNRSSERPELKAEEAQLHINELNKLQQHNWMLPTVSAYGAYSALQLSDTFNPIKAGSWFPYNYIGIKASIPIFDGKQAKLAANDYAIRQQINRNTIEKYKNDFAYETQMALKQLEQAKLDIEETKKNIALAQQLLATDTFRYEKGVLTFAELKNTEFSLQNSENNYLASVYNFLLATINYKKAIGGL